MIDEMRIQFALFRRLISKGHQIIIPNVDWSLLRWEADLISVLKSNYMSEFEIKINRQDFENDFKKRKHLILKRAPKTLSIPNYFWYVAPIKAIPLCIPDYAGLIEVNYVNRYRYGLYLREIKRPKLLHKEKQTSETLCNMLRAMSYKYWNLAETLDSIKIQRNIFKSQSIEQT